MSAIITNNMRVLNALNCKKEDNLYFAIGRTTPWTDENTPDTPLTSQTEVEELIYIKKISIKHNVIIDDPYDAYAIDVEVNGINYNYVLEAEVFEKYAHFLYLSETIDY